MSWQKKSLGNLLISSGNTRAGRQDLPVLSITMRDGLVDQSAKFKKRIASRDVSNYRVVYKNELVVGFPIDEGVLGFQTNYPAAVVSPAYGVWKLRNPEEVHIPFIQSYLRSGEARQIYAKRMRGVVARRRSISAKDFLEIEIPFPPLEEQKRIATVVRKAEQLRSQRQESLQLAERFLESLFLDMFGDPVTNPKGWRIVNFGREMEKIDYGTSVKCSEIEEPGSRPVLRIPNVVGGRISWDELKFAGFSHSEWSRLKVLAGDILFVRTNGNPSMVARSAVFEGVREAAFASYLIRVRLRPESEFKPGFINFALAMPSFRSQLLKLARTTAGNYNINTRALKGLELILPDTDLQDRFCEIVVGQRVFAEILRESLHQADFFICSIQERAFQGKLNLDRHALDSHNDELVAPELLELAVEPTRTSGGLIILHAPEAIEAALKDLDRIVQAGESISWSPDYFKYRILGTQTAPFGFGELMQKAESVFDEPPPYEEIKDMFLDLLGHGGDHAFLRQSFDLHVDAESKKVSGRKEMVFEPTA
jgi:type I restriction enzyme S subunit